MAQLCALVAVENVAYHFDILYSYVVPEELRQSCTAGSWVQVPFGKGNAQRQGIVFSVEDAQPDEKCKPVTKVLSDEPLLSESMIELALFLKDRTFCTFYDAARIQLPAGFNFRLNVTYIALENKEGKKLSGDEAAVYGFLSENPAYFSKRDVCRALSLPETTSAFEKLLSKGLIGRNYDSSKRIGNISVKMAVLRYSAEEISTNFLSITPKQQAVLDVLFDVGSCSVKELCYYSGVTSAVVSALEKKGVI